MGRAPQRSMPQRNTKKMKSILACLALFGIAPVVFAQGGG